MRGKVFAHAVDTNRGDYTMPKAIGSGSVIRRDRKKDGTLQPRHRCRLWDLSVTMDDGSHPSVRFEGTEREALRRLPEWVAEMEEMPPAGTPTFAEYASAWHARRERGGMLAKRTLAGEEPKLKAAAMHLGRIKMTEITVRDVENCYMCLLRGSTPSGKPYSPKSLDNVHRVLSALFREAVRDGIIQDAPTSGAKRPKVPPTDRLVPSRAEVDALVESLECAEPHHMAIMLCACFGLRRSEAVMLDWADWDGSRILVNKAAEEDGTPKPTKNVTTRMVPAPPRAKAILDEYAGTGRICQMTPSALTQWWERHRSEFGMEGVQLHGLRHAYATRLAEAGVHPRTMMQLGGWRSIDVCMRIYTHVNSGALDDAVAAAFDLA